MKTKFIKHFAALFLFLGTSTALFTACSDDDNIPNVEAVQKGEINAFAEHSFSIDPEIETANTSYVWYDTTTGRVRISTEPTLTYTYNEPGTYEITLNIYTNQTFTDSFVYKVIVAENNEVVLDLSNFDLSNGIETAGGKVWSETYSEDAVLQSGIFKFNHIAIPDWYTWLGFTVSNATDNQDQMELPGGWLDNQWGTMPKGGVDGEGTPFIVAFADHKPAEGVLVPNEPIDVSRFSCSVELADDARYEAVNTQIAISPWPYYGILNGDAYARAFEEGDYFALHIYGLDKDMKLTTTQPVTHYMVDFRNGITDISTDWNNVDLSPLGEVKYLLFFLETTDVGEWGANTALYFTMDKLKVRKID